jgi:hypothetical protein
VPLAAVNATTADGLYSWPTENPAFISALKGYVKAGTERYLIAGYASIPEYYVGAPSSLQWKEVAHFSYVDPQTGKSLSNGPALADAIQHGYFSLIILNFQGNGIAGEPADDYLAAADIAKYGHYAVAGHLPPSNSVGHNYYTVWRLTGGR